MRQVLIASAAASVMGLAPAAQATLISYEPFSQPTVVTTTGSGGTGLYSSSDPDASGAVGNGFNGNWILSAGTPSSSIATSSLSSSYAQPSEDGSVVYSIAAKSATSTFDSRSLSTSTSANSLFVSYLINDNSAAVSTAAGSPAVFMKLFTAGLGTQVAAFGYQPTFNSADWALKVGSGTTGPSNTIDSGIVAGAGSGTTMLVAELDYASPTSGTVEFYVGNSTTGTLEEVGSLTSQTLASVGEIQMDAIGGGASAGTALSATFDEIRIGTSLADVTASTPEPASLGLIGAVSTIGLLRRRTVANRGSRA